MKDDRDNILGLTLEELEETITDCGAEKFRAQQIFKWIFEKHATSFSEMTDIPAKLKKTFSEKLTITLPSIEKCFRSKDGTEKFLMKLSDGNLIESVLIPEEKRMTICASSQIGCALNCAFCLTGRMGFKRNLDVEEITGQVIRIVKERKNRQKKINIVLMGMGEPFLNYANILKFLTIMTSPEGMNLSRKRITVSTVGLPHEINDLSLERVRPKLAVSLSATTNATRSTIMPINKKHNIESVLRACRNYCMKTSERITFEYILMDQVNDSPEDARRLVKLLHGIPSKVNIIPINEAEKIPFKRPPGERITKFRETLVEKGIDATVRKGRGLDILAACGQLFTG